MSAPDEFETELPRPVADAAHRALVTTALRQAANAQEDGRGAAGRVVQRARELTDIVTTTAAAMAGELNTAGTPAELLAEAHLRGIVHHIGAYLRASAEAASETGEDLDATMRRALSMVRAIAGEARPPKQAP
ncbi:hypothetical protein [Streptomyces tubercidicus]|uniref:hypothetical protein n=1 Tax=Streptomyces tubercidicus TaxID=47759 RepID=UPI002E1096BB|nr:hypothetical protein OG761_21500 [Streptomyces tubercidicus]